MAIFTRLPSGEWGVCLDSSDRGPADGPVTAGTVVRVTKRNGRTNYVTARAFVGRNSYGEELWSFTDERRSTTPARGIPAWNTAARRNLDDANEAARRAAPVPTEVEAEREAARRENERAEYRPAPRIETARRSPAVLAAAAAPEAPPAALRLDDSTARAVREAAERRAAPVDLTPALGFPRVTAPEPVAPAARAAVRDLVLAGAAAEGSGALVGWDGVGPLPLSAIVEKLTAAGLPLDWAPSAKSADAHLGKAVGDLNHAGYVARKAAAPKRGERNWRVRWTVFRVEGNRSDLIEIELPTDTDELRVYLDPDRRDEAEPIARKISERYAELRGGEIFQAGDVTSWLSRALVGRCGATGYALGYYVPGAGRELASRLCAPFAESWGKNWAYPLLPVATGPELAIGIGRSFAGEVKRVAGSLETARKRAVTEKRTEVRPGEAAALLRDLAAIQDRVGAYRVLCGDAVVAPIVVEIGALRDVLLKLTDDASVRFSLLDVKAPEEVAADAPVAEAPTVAERAADAAADARRGTTPPVGVPVTPVAPPPAPAAPAAEIDPDDRAANDSAERFSLLELD